MEVSSLLSDLVISRGDCVYQFMHWTLMSGQHHYDQAHHRGKQQVLQLDLAAGIYLVHHHPLTYSLVLNIISTLSCNDVMHKIIRKIMRIYLNYSFQKH